jgi:hypothetical protein
MEPITLIVTALAAGASAGAIDALKDNAKETASAAYARLRGLARKRVAGRPDGELALERHETAPQKWEAVLTGELTAAGAASDVALLSAAEAFMELIDQVGTKSGKYSLTIKDSKGVQVGDGNVQVNRF